MPQMTLKEVQEHIEKTMLEPLKAEFGEKLKETVALSVETALKPIKGDIGTAQAEQKALMQKVTEAGKGPSQIPNAPRTREKGEAFGRMVWALKRTHNNPEKAVELLDHYGDKDLSEMLKNAIPDSSIKAMTAGDPETGGILIPQPVAQEVIDILRAQVVVRSFNPATLPMPSGNLKLPKKTQGTTAYYVGEGTQPTISKVKTGHVNLSYKKLVTLVPVSNDLFRFSSPGADRIIRDDIVDNTRVREDQAFLRDNGTDSTPKGLLQWALDASPAQVVNANQTVNLANVTTDLGKLILKLIEANVPMIRPGWIMSPRTWNYLMTVLTTNGPYAFRDEMSRGTLWGWPFRFTTQVPNNLTTGGGVDKSDLYLADFADVVIGDSETLKIDASGEASYVEGGSVKSAFGQDETVIRGITEHDMVMRRDASIAVLRQVKWGV